MDEPALEMPDIPGADGPEDDEEGDSHLDNQQNWETFGHTAPGFTHFLLFLDLSSSHLVN